MRRLGIRICSLAMALTMLGSMLPVSARAEEPAEDGPVLQAEPAEDGPVLQAQPAPVESIRFEKERPVGTEVRIEPVTTPELTLFHGYTWYTYAFRVKPLDGKGEPTDGDITLTAFDKNGTQLRDNSYGTNAAWVTVDPAVPNRIELHLPKKYETESSSPIKLVAETADGQVHAELSLIIEWVDREDPQIFGEGYWMDQEGTHLYWDCTDKDLNYFSIRWDDGEYPECIYLDRTVKEYLIPDHEARVYTIQGYDFDNIAGMGGSQRIVVSDLDKPDVRNLTITPTVQGDLATWTCDSRIIKEYKLSWGFPEVGSAVISGDQTSYLITDWSEPLYAEIAGVGWNGAEDYPRAFHAEENKPTVPGNFRVAEKTPTSATFAWEPSTDDSGIAHYELWMDHATPGASFAPSKNYVIPADQTSFTVSLGPGESLDEIRLYAWDRAGNSSYTAQLEQDKPVYPLRPELDIEGQNRYVIDTAHLSRSIPVQASVYVRNSDYALSIVPESAFLVSSDGTERIPMAIDGTTLSADWKASGRKPGRYSYYVEAMEQSGISLRSGSYVEFTVVRDSGAAPKISSAYIQLTDPTPPDGHDLRYAVYCYVSDESGVDSISYYFLPNGRGPEQELTGETQFYPGDSAANDNITYGSITLNRTDFPLGNHKIKVVARDGAGHQTQQLLDFRLDDTAPAAPAQLTALTSSEANLLSWDRSSAADTAFYRVYRAEAQNGPFRLISPEFLFHDDIRYTDQHRLLPGRTYYYQVRTVDFSGNESSPSKTEAVTYSKDGPRILSVYPETESTITTNGSLSVTASDPSHNLVKAQFYLYDKEQRDYQLIRETPTEPNNPVAHLKTFSMPLSFLPAQDDKGASMLVRIITSDPQCVAQQHLHYSFTGIEYYRKVELSLVNEGDEALNPQAGLAWTADFPVLRYDVCEVDPSGKIIRQLISLPGSARAYKAQVEPEKTTWLMVRAWDHSGTYQDSNIVSKITETNSNGNAPLARISPYIGTVSTGVPVILSSGESESSSPISSYLWELRQDGSQEVLLTQKEPFFQHTFQKDGRYTLTLTLTDSNGKTGSRWTYIDVTERADRESVSVQVVNNAAFRNPVPYAAMQLEDSWSSVCDTVQVTDGEGIATYVPHSHGEWACTAWADGYVPVTRFVSSSADSPAPQQLLIPKAEVGMNGVAVRKTRNTMEISGNVQLTANGRTGTSHVRASFDTRGQLISEVQSNPQDPGWGWTKYPELDCQVGILPLTDHLLMVVYGRSHWTKQITRVDLVAFAGSNERLGNCQVTLGLPKGFCLAELPNRKQQITADLGSIPAGGAKSFSWYIYREENGNLPTAEEAVLGGSINATLDGQPFSRAANLRSPISFFSDKALGVTVIADDVAIWGDAFTCDFKLENLSNIPMYDLSFALCGAESFTAYTSDQPDRELHPQDFSDGKTVSVGTLPSGESVIISYSLPNGLPVIPGSSWELSELLQNTLLPAMEENWRDVHYESEIRHVPHGTFVDTAEKGNSSSMDMVGGRQEQVALPASGLKVYKFQTAGTEAPEDADLSDLLKVTLGPGAYFIDSDNTVTPFAVPTVGVYTDAPKERCTIEGDTMTIRGSASVYVKGESAGDASISVTTYVDSKPVSSTMSYSISDTPQQPAAITEVVLQAPRESLALIPDQGQTAQIVFPYVLKTEDGSLLAQSTPENWSITLDGQPVTQQDGLQMDNGVVTVSAEAKPGVYTVTLTAEQHSSQQKFTLATQADLLSAQLRSTAKGSKVSLSFLGNQSLRATVILAGYDAQHRLVAIGTTTGTITADSALEVMLEDRDHKSVSLKLMLLDPDTNAPLLAPKTF